MKNSNNLHKKAATNLDSVFACLQEDHLYKTIDYPIDLALSGYELPNPLPEQYSDMIKHLGNCIFHLYSKGEFSLRKLNYEQARTEAIDILERGYQGESSRGFAVAFQDAAHQQKDDFLFIVEQLISILKTEHRNKYIQWVMAKYIDSCDWRLKREIIQIFFTRFKPLLPDILLKRSPANLVEYIPDLIFMQIQTNQSIKQTISMYGKYF